MLVHCTHCSSFISSVLYLMGRWTGDSGEDLTRASAFDHISSTDASQLSVALCTGMLWQRLWAVCYTLLARQHTPPSTPACKLHWRQVNAQLSRSWLIKMQHAASSNERLPHYVPSKAAVLLQQQI